MNHATQQIGASAEQVAQIKRWIIQTLGLEDHITMVAVEFPGPATRVTVIDLPVPPRHFMVPKALVEITSSDIAVACRRTQPPPN